jgi:hypothetical protein
MLQNPPANCPKCGVDLDPNCGRGVRQFGYIGATWGGEIQQGRWEDDGDGAKVNWDVCEDLTFNCGDCGARIPIEPTVEHVEAAIRYLRLARTELEYAGSSKTLDRLRATLASAYGARRHASLAEIREQRRKGAV